MTAGDVIVISKDAGGKKGVYYDGTDDYTLIDAHAVARVLANDTTGTYSAWIFLDDIGATVKTILSTGDDNSANENFQIISAYGSIRTSLKHGGTTQFDIRSSNYLLSKRTWTHIAVVQNGTQPVIYIEGEVVAATNNTATNLTFWYDELTLCDKFAIGVSESNATHTQDFIGAIGQVKYWNKALDASEILEDYKGNALSDDTTYLQLNITMEDDGTTDAGLGADNGTLTGNAHYGGLISDFSYTMEANVTGHAAEFINTFKDGSKYVSIIKRGD